MNKLRNYFDYNYKPTLQGEMITQLLNETSILEAEDILKKDGQDSANIYFKLLAHVMYLEEEPTENKDDIAYLYYLIGYYIGLFYHPTNGDEIAKGYLNMALKLSNDQQLIEKCLTTIAMIDEEIS